MAPVDWLEEALSVPRPLFQYGPTLSWTIDDMYAELQLRHFVQRTIETAYRQIETNEAEFIRLISDAWRQVQNHRQPDAPLTETTDQIDLTTELTATAQDASHIAFEIALDTPDLRNPARSFHRLLADVLTDASDADSDLRDLPRLHRATLHLADDNPQKMWPIVSEVFDRDLPDPPAIKPFLDNTPEKRSSNYRDFVNSLHALSVTTDDFDFDKDEFYVY